MSSETSNMTDEQYQDHLAKLHHAPGSSLDLIAEIMSYGLDDSLHEYQLEISTTYGLQLVVPCENEDDRDTVRIPLPEDKTVGDLIAALFVCPLPSLILHTLRAATDHGAFSWTATPGAFDDAILKFLDVLEHFDGREIQSWFQGIYEEVKSGGGPS